MASPAALPPVIVRPDVLVTDAAELQAVIDAALAKGCAVVPLLAPTPPLISCPDHRSLPNGALLSLADLVEVFGIRPRYFDRTRKRLERFRREDDAGWVEIANSRMNEPHFYFKVGSVRPILLALLEEIHAEQASENQAP